MAVTMVVAVAMAVIETVAVAVAVAVAKAVAAAETVPVATALIVADYGITLSVHPLDVEGGSKQKNDLLLEAIFRFKRCFKAQTIVFSAAMEFSLLKVQASRNDFKSRHDTRLYIGRMLTFFFLLLSHFPVDIFRPYPSLFAEVWLRLYIYIYINEKENETVKCLFFS